MTPDDDKPLTPAQARQKLQKGLIDYLAGKDPGPIVFRLKRTKKASETYPLKLTQQQRETLLRCIRLSRDLKKKIKHAGDGTQIVPVTWNELHKLNDGTGEAVAYTRNGDMKRLMAVQARVDKFFEDELAEVFDGGVPEVLDPRLYALQDGLWGAYRIRPSESRDIASAEAWLMKRKWRQWRS